MTVRDAGRLTAPGGPTAEGGRGLPRAGPTALMIDRFPEDAERLRLRERLAGVLVRAEKTASWRGSMDRLRPLAEAEQHVAVRARLSREDLDFLAVAREELIELAVLGLRLLDLHRPRDAGGVSSDRAHPILRCRSCMWRWPCPTFRAMAEALDDLPEPGAPRRPAPGPDVWRPDPQAGAGKAAGPTVDRGDPPGGRRTGAAGRTGGTGRDVQPDAGS